MLHSPYISTDRMYELSIFNVALSARNITPVVGFMGDKFGYKRVLNIATVLVLILSVVRTFSWCIEVLIVIRILFGFTAGMLMPLSMAMLYQSVPQSRQVKVAAMCGSANIVGGAIPNILTGLIITYASWHILFWMMVPLVALLLICNNKFPPAAQAHGNMKLDTMGFALTTVDSFALLFSFQQFGQLGHNRVLCHGYESWFVWGHIFEKMEHRRCHA